MNLVIHIHDFLLLTVAYFVGSLIKINRKYRNIWLISERQTDARDNGYHLFCYLRNNHPEINAYYIITDNSVDRHKIAHLGNIVSANNRWIHFLYFSLAENLVGAHANMGIPHSAICWKSIQYIKKNLLFIQHGVIKELIPSFFYGNSRYRLFVTSALDEYNFVNQKFGYPKNSVQYLGLCRYDALHKIKTKKEILLMPTWRAWLKISQTFGNPTDFKDDFLDTEYYKTYQRLINSNQLHQLLEIYGYNLIFFPHHEVQGCLDLFFTNSNRVIIASEQNYDVQTLLKESEILISDFSSVVFDFAYMRKSVLYYQFDEEKYFSSHFTKGYFDYYKNGFGPISKDENSLLKHLEEIIIGLSQNEKYKERAMAFFPLFDQDNCKRTYEAIRNIN